MERRVTTKELIKQLQEADPEGKCHVRIHGGSVFSCERKPGYWDGPYEYLEGDTYVFSTRGDKIDIHTLDPGDWIYHHLDDWRENIRIEYDHCDKKHEEKVVEMLEKEEIEWREIIEKHK